MARRPVPRRIVAITVVTAVLLAWLVPASRARAAAGATVAEALGIVDWRPLAPPVTVQELVIGDGPADVYRPGIGTPTVVLVPGATPAGRDDPRVRRLARALARADRQVVVPELAVYDEELVEADVERLVNLVLDLTVDEPDVVLAGISFGGSLALLAAASPGLDGRVAGVATFGAYADLVGVLQAATTGATVVEGKTIPWEGDPRAEQVVRDQLIRLLDPASARSVRGALANEAPDQARSPGARAVHDVLANDDPKRARELARRLPDGVRTRLDMVSPVSVADRLADVPILAMHARNDPIIPHGELARLGATIPSARLLTVHGMAHADLRLAAPEGWMAGLGDAQTMWSFTSQLLRWQEPMWPWGPG